MSTSSSLAVKLGLASALMALVVSVGVRTLGGEEGPNAPVAGALVPEARAQGPSAAPDLTQLPAPAPGSGEPAAAPARPEKGNPNTTLEDDLRYESFGSALIQLVIVLGIVLALVYLLLNFGLRRLMGLKHVSVGRSDLIRVVERIPLEQRVSLYVVKAGTDYLLLGRTDQGLTTLHKLAPEEVERVEKAKAESAAQMSPFLQKLLSRRGGPPPTA